MASIGTWISNNHWFFEGTGGLLLLSVGSAILHVPRKIRDHLSVRAKRTKREPPLGVYVPSNDATATADRESPDLLPWHRKPDDRIGTIADTILKKLHEADGQGLYLVPVQHQIGCSNLEIEEAVSRLRRHGMIEALGGFPNPHLLNLTGKGRAYVLD